MAKIIPFEKFREYNYAKEMELEEFYTDKVVYELYLLDMHRYTNANAFTFTSRLRYAVDNLVYGY